MKPTSDLQFLPDNGEMSTLIRQTDWCKTPVGPPAQWPKSLQTMLGVILHSRFPMFIWWGPELICFYNDAYRPSLGKEGKHPSILGQPAKQAWAEIWDIIKPLIEQVLCGGDATWSEDQLIPIFRNGKIEDVYWTFSYSCINNDEGKPYGVLVTCVETTQKIMNQRQLEDAHDFFKFSTDAAELGTWDYNPLTGKFKSNDRLREWLGIRGREEIDLPVAINAVAPEDRERVMTAINAALDHSIQPGYDIEYKIIHTITKQERIVVAKGKPFFNEQNIAYRFSGTLEDITEKSQAKKILEKSETNFRSLVQQAPVAMCVLKGPRHIVEIANDRMIKLWGKERHDVMNRPIFQGLHEAKEQGLEDLLDNVYKTGERFIAKERPVNLPRGSGIETIYQNFVYEPFLDIDGSVAGVIAVTIDVTEQVLARQKVEEAEERARLAIEAAEIGTFDFNMEANIAITSPRLHEIFDAPVHASNEELVKHIHPDDKKIREKALVDALNSGQLFYEVRIARKDKTIRWVRVEGKLLFSSGTPFRMLGTALDITEKKELDQKREEYIAIASHELRNPLTSLKLSLELMDSNEINETEKKRFVEKSKANVQRIMTMTDELLNVSKIAAGMLDLKMEIFNLNDSIYESIATMQAGDEKNPVVVTGTADISVRGDKFRIEQVLVNLISNASKYSPAGSPIIIYVSQENNMVRVEVKDKGIGIDAENIAFVFQKFIRLDSATHVKGYGLGLYISEQIIRKHGGEMGVESEKGKGSIFWFTLPH